MHHPLADEIRPQTLDEVVGQRHLLAPGAVLRRLIESGADVNMVFYGPSGTGKTTIANLIHLLKQAGALSVHVRICSPPFLYPCYFGTDIPSNRQLIASSHTEEEIRQLIGADSLGYMKIQDLQSMVGSLPLCRACFDGQYPMDISQR